MFLEIEVLREILNIVKNKPTIVILIYSKISAVQRCFKGNQRCSALNQRCFRENQRWNSAVSALIFSSENFRSEIFRWWTALKQTWKYSESELISAECLWDINPGRFVVAVIFCLTAWIILLWSNFFLKGHYFSKNVVNYATNSTTAKKRRYAVILEKMRETSGSALTCHQPQVKPPMSWQRSAKWMQGGKLVKKEKSNCKEWILTWYWKKKSGYLSSKKCPKTMLLSVETPIFGTIFLRNAGICFL